MLVPENVLVSILDNDGKFDDKVKGEIPSLLLPDAIRMYSGPRQYTHFEKSSSGGESSYWTFPTDIKSMTRESVQQRLAETGYLADVKPAAIGELTDFEAFQTYNEGVLPDEMYRGLEHHMMQDIVFDDAIRAEIDCSKKYDNEFVFNGKTYDDKEVRKLITEIEQQGIYVAAKAVYEKTGIIANQEWFDENVKPILQEAYPEELAENTCKFIKIDDKINEYITQCDWSHVHDGPVLAENLEAMFDKIHDCYNNGIDSYQNDFETIFKSNKRAAKASAMVDMEEDMSLQDDVEIMKG